MHNKYTLVDNLYLYLTPVGAYYAVTDKEVNKSRTFLRRWLKEPATPALNGQTLMQLMQLDEASAALELLHHCQDLGWVQGADTSIQPPEEALELILPQLLENLSETGKVLLADDQGFYLACHGFPHEVAEELSALSAELATVHQRRTGVLMNNLGIYSHAWAIVDTFGGSQIGFWPIFTGHTRFVIIISGVPHFNQTNFTTLIWVLSRRYG